MQYPIHFHRFALKNLQGSLFGKCPHTDDPIGLKDFDDFSQMVITNDQQRGKLGGRQFVRSPIASARLQKGQRTEIRHEMIRKKIPRIWIAIREKSPEPLPADLATFAGETFHRSLGMFPRRFADGTFNLQPVLHGVNLSKWNSGLHHAEWTWIHAQEDHFLARASVTGQIRRV